MLLVVIGKSVLHSRNGLPQKLLISLVTSRFGYNDSQHLATHAYMPLMSLSR